MNRRLGSIIGAAIILQILVGCGPDLTPSQPTGATGHSGAISAARFSPDESRIVTASWDKTAKVWDAEDGRLLMTLSGHTAPIFSAIYSTKGDKVYTADTQGTVKVWDAATGEMLKSSTLKPHRNEFKDTVASNKTGRPLPIPKGTSGISILPNSHMVLWSKYESEKNVFGSFGNPLHHVTTTEEQYADAGFSPEGICYWSTTVSPKGELWALNVGSFREVVNGVQPTFDKAAVMPDGRKFVSGGFNRPNNGIRWEVASRDGKRKISSDMNKVHVKDTGTGKALFALE